MPRARVTAKGQVTIPIEVRRSLGIEQGDEVLFELTRHDMARVRVYKRPRLTEFYGALPPTRAFRSKEEVRSELGRALARTAAVG
ncbi:MAG: AbrB/MazE/SpoVT family DNA-binding domain-containing protein [Thermoanaerobaculia bacterium]